jgi:hypothetical protein
MQIQVVPFNDGVGRWPGSQRAIIREAWANECDYKYWLKESWRRMLGILVMVQFIEVNLLLVLSIYEAVSSSTVVLTGSTMTMSTRTTPTSPLQWTMLPQLAQHGLKTLALRSLKIYAKTF